MTGRFHTLGIILKYSILIPFFNRTKEFKITLDSYCYWYEGQADYEVLIGVDVKNKEGEALKALINTHPEIKFRLFETGLQDCFIPGPAFNFLAQKAEGETLVLTNPETVHLANILESIRKNASNNYLVFACEAGYVDDFTQKYPNLKYRHHMWYQHSIHNNRMLHFCSAISKKQYFEIGGFDEEYAKGIGYDDNDFIQKIRTNGITPIAIDDVRVLHIEHDRSYNNNSNLTETNRLLYEQKWGIRLP